MLLTMLFPYKNNKTITETVFNKLFTKINLDITITYKTSLEIKRGRFSKEITIWRINTNGTSLSGKNIVNCYLLRKDFQMSYTYMK